MDAEALAKKPTPTYRHLSNEELVAGARQMLDDLNRLAREDGCIAAAWALDLIEHMESYELAKGEPR